MKTTMKTTTYGQPAIGCYLDHGNYSSDELSEEICRLAIGFGWEPDDEAAAVIDADMDDERSNGPDVERSEQLDELAQEAEDWLNGQEIRSFLWWGNDGECGAFGLWPNVDGAKEDCAFVSSKAQEWPADDFRGEWLHINDRGNVTLYVRETTGGQSAFHDGEWHDERTWSDREVWSVV